MVIYVGISKLTNDLIYGEMYEKTIEQNSNYKTELEILEFQELHFHPVDACIKFIL